MSKPQENSENSKPDNHPPPPVNAGDVETPKSVEEAQHGHKRANNPHHKPKILKRVIAFFYRDGNQYKVANLIAFGMLIATVILAYYTWKVFNQTIKQTEISQKSADAAKVSADAAKFSADLQKQALDSQIAAKKGSDISEKERVTREERLFILQKKTLKNNEKDIKERFTRDTSAIGLQIKALRQNQDQFTKQNEPYLRIDIDSVYTMFNELKFRYTINDLSNTPVRIVGERSFIVMSGITPIVLEPLIDNFDGVVYVTKDAPQGHDITIKGTTPDKIKWVMSGTYSIYWKARFTYVNQITEEKRIYKITVKINRTRGQNPPYQKFTDNDNKSE